MSRSVAGMAVYPWIDLKEPLTVCGVDFLPRGIAIQRAGDLAAHVEAGTSYFRDNLLDGAPQFGGPPLSLRPLSPSVVLLDSMTTSERVEIANLVWFMSVLFANDLQFSYANATTFAHFYQRLGGEPGVHARRTRRMHGHKLSGSMVVNVIDVKPQWCENYHDPDEDMLALLQAVIDRPQGEPIRNCIACLLLATSDEDTSPPDAEHANYARALERLLYRPGQTSDGRDGQQRSLAVQLLRPLVPGHKGPWQILEVRDAVRDHRNAFWHPEDRKNATRAFEKQTAVRPNLMAFHATAALVIASAHAILGGELPERLASYVPAIEEWLGSIEEDDPRPSEVASDFREIWSKVSFQNVVARYIRENPVSAANTVP